MAGKVFINGREAIYKDCKGVSIAFPDVCLCPPGPPSGPIPVPLPNTVKAKDLDGLAATVTIGGQRVAHAKSFFARSTGNEVAKNTGGGIVTHVTQGEAHFITYSRNVTICGQPAVRHMDLLKHNQANEMVSNTPPAPWMSSMDPSVPPVVPKQVTREKKEGKESITLVFLDETGAPLQAIDCSLTTPKGAVVEARPGSTGTLVLKGLAKGKCQLALPRHDTKCEKISRSPPKNSRSGSVLYKPGETLSLETGKQHQVVVPWTLHLTVNMCVGDAGSPKPKDKLVLRSGDGSYSHTAIVHDKAGHKRWHMRVEFPALIPGATYTLEHQPEDGSKPHKVFVDRPFDELMAPEKRRPRKRD